MIRTIIILIYFMFYLLLSFGELFRIHRLLKINDVKAVDDFCYNKAKKWGRKLLKLSGSKVKVIGEEHIPKDQAVVFVCNHQSMFDIPVLYGHIDKQAGFIAKVEIKKIPIIGTWMNKLHCVFMDRKNIRQSLMAINQGVNYVKQGYSMVIFPEGTRSRTDEMLPFKPGSLKLALKSGAPIVPLTIRGSREILGRKGMRISPANVELVVSEPVYIDNNKRMDIHEFAKKIQGIVESRL